LTSLLGRKKLRFFIKDNGKMNHLKGSDAPIALVNETQVRVTYRDTDQMGFAYYANYLVWFEMGRTELLRQAGYTYKQLESRNMFLPVHSCFCEYKTPARYDDLIRIRTRIANLSRASMSFEYEIYRHETDELLAKGETKHAFINHEGKIIRVGDEVRKILQGASENPSD
jgi:acyl-CoA thioester hydrolase